MKEVQPEIEQGAGNRRSVDEHVALHQMPVARTHHEGRGLLVQRVPLAIRAREADAAGDGIAQVDLPLDHVRPRRAIGILEIRHEDAGAGVQGVDHHLAVGGAGDLDAPVLEILGLGRHGPGRFAHARGLGKEVRHLSGVELGLPHGAAREQLLAPGFKLAREPGDKRQRVVRENLCVLRRERPANFDSCWIGVTHHVTPRRLIATRVAIEVAQTIATRRWRPRWSARMAQ